MRYNSVGTVKKIIYTIPLRIARLYSILTSNLRLNSGFDIKTVESCDSINYNHTLYGTITRR